MLKQSVLALASVMISTAAYADLNISKKQTLNMNCSGGVCTATAQKAVLNVTDLASMLASGDVAVEPGTLAKDIDIDQPLTWSSASRLTLDAKRSITVKKPVSVPASGAVTIDYNNKDGDLVFLSKGKIDFSGTGSSLLINGTDYVLTNDIASLAAAVAKNPSGNFAFSTDYDAGGATYNDAPVGQLNGNFEGLGHTISNLVIRERFRVTDVGFFAMAGGSVRNLVLKNISLGVGKALEGGALAGRNGGLIAHVHVTADINAKERTQSVGGLVGNNYIYGIIVKSSANVHGAVAGGLIGTNEGAVDQSFAEGRTRRFGGGLIGNVVSGSVTNTYSSTSVAAGGGLIGEGNLAVQSSYSTGQVGQLSGFGSGGFVAGVDTNNVQNAYWDVDTSGQTQGCGDGADCSGITGLSDAQLKSGLPAGFDPKIWGQSPKINNGYPYLLVNPPR